MKHIIHVHQRRIKQGAAAIIDRTYKGVTHSRTLTIICTGCGDDAARVIQSDEPDHCGARVWIEAGATR